MFSHNSKYSLPCVGVLSAYVNYYFPGTSLPERKIRFDRQKKFSLDAIPSAKILGLAFLMNKSFPLSTAE